MRTFYVLSCFTDKAAIGEIVRNILPTGYKYKLLQPRGYSAAPSFFPYLPNPAFVIMVCSTPIIILDDPFLYHLADNGEQGRMGYDRTSINRDWWGTLGNKDKSFNLIQ